MVGGPFPASFSVVSSFEWVVPVTYLFQSLALELSLPLLFFQQVKSVSTDVSYPIFCLALLLFTFCFF